MTDLETVIAAHVECRDAHEVAYRRMDEFTKLTNSTAHALRTVVHEDAFDAHSAAVRALELVREFPQVRPLAQLVSASAARAGSAALAGDAGTAEEMCNAAMDRLELVERRVGALREYHAM